MATIVKPRQGGVNELELALGLLFGALTTLSPRDRNGLLSLLLIGAGAYFFVKATQ